MQIYFNEQINIQNASGGASIIDNSKKLDNYIAEKK